MRINYKNLLDIGLIEISNSVKNKETGEWECDFLYNGEKLTVTSPKIRISDNIIVFDAKKRESFVKFITSLEETVVEYLCKNSDKLFKGKKFTKDRIRNSIVPSIYIDDCGLSYIQTTEYPHLKCFNFFLENIQKEELEEEVTAEILVDSIIFDKELFRIDYKLSKLKNSKVKIPRELDFNSEKEITEGNFFE